MIWAYRRVLLLALFGAVATLGCTQDASRTFETSCQNLRLYLEPGGTLPVPASRPYVLQDQGSPGSDACDRDGPVDGDPVVLLDCHVLYPAGWSEPTVVSLPPRPGRDDCRL